MRDDNRFGRRLRAAHGVRWWWDESESDFTYSEGDMEQLVVGTWTGSWRLAGAQSSPLCASREFSVATSDDSLEPGSRLTCTSMSFMTLTPVI